MHFRRRGAWWWFPSYASVRMSICLKGPGIRKMFIFFYLTASLRKLESRNRLRRLLVQDEFSNRLYGKGTTLHIIHPVSGDSLHNLWQFFLCQLVNAKHFESIDHLWQAITTLLRLLVTRKFGISSDPTTPESVAAIRSWRYCIRSRNSKELPKP